MKGIKTRAIAGVFVVAILVISYALAGCVPSPGTPEGKVLNLMCSTGSVTSGAYLSQVAMAKIINEHVPEVKITLVETTGAWVNVGRLGKDMDMFSQVTYEAAAARYNGVSSFEGKPFKDVRMFYLYSTTAYQFLVRADSGVKTLKDLAGKKYYLGAPGSASEGAGTALFAKLGIKIDQVWGSETDAVAMIKENRIVGFHKGSGLTGFDASMVDIKSVTPIRLLCMTEEEAATAARLFPGWFIREFPAGSIPGAEDQGLIRTWAVGAGSGMTTALPEGIVYKMMKALCENWQDMKLSYPSGWDTATTMAENSIRIIADIKGVQPVPLHAGVVRYFKELGKTIPASIIPPEYKG